MQGNIKTVLAEQGVRVTRGTNKVKRENRLQVLTVTGCVGGGRVRQDEMLEPRCGPSRNQPRGSTRQPWTASLPFYSAVCAGRRRGTVCTTAASSNRMVPDKAESRSPLK